MASDDLINKSFGQYEIKSLLGRGGMATVYLARQKSMDRDVAVKVMAKELADDEQFVARFEHEAQLIAKLQHPHILPVIDFGREDNLIYIVMRLVRGGSLDDRLKGGPLPLNLASRMLTQIASALTFAHEQGIIHRDLKPNNVLLDERDNAYLTDFGIAKMLAGTSKLTATGNILGTPSYMAPEQWRGEPVDARTDIYSLGVVLYEMVLGQLPFSGETPYTLMYQHFNDPPPPPREINPDLNPGIEAVILRALSKLADGRYQSADAMAEDFANAVRGLPTSGDTPVGLDKTVIGAEEGAGYDRTMVPPRQGTPATPPGGPPSAHTPSGAAAPVPAAAPAKKGLSPLVIGIAAVVLLAILGGGAYALFGGGGGEDKTNTPVALVPSDTPTATDTLTPEVTNTPEPTATNTLTDTPQPTDTSTLTPTDTPTLTPTDTPSTTTATVLSQIASVRRGPGFNYDVVDTLQRDQQVIVIGVSDDGMWFQVIGGGLVQVGWISAESVRISGNPNISVVVWPTDTPTRTPTPTDTPTETLTPTDTPSPTDTPTETLTPTDTPSPTDTPTETLTPTDTPSPTDTPTETLTPTDTPSPTDTPTETPTPTDTPSPTDTPTETPTPTDTPTDTPSPTFTPEVTATATPAPVSEALFVPAEFIRVTLPEYGIALDYPSNWTSPRYFATLGYASMFPDNEVDLSRYPWIRIARGTPQDLLNAELTGDISSPAAAVENTKGMVAGAHEVVDGTSFPTYALNSRTSTRNNWAWVVEVGPEDWVYIIAYVPLVEYEPAFTSETLPSMVQSITIDDRALFGGGELVANETLFLPTEFERVSLDEIGVALDYPVSWQRPTNYGSGIDYFINVVDSADPSADLYPGLTIARGTPDAILDTGMTSDINSPVAALENLYGVSFSGQSQVVTDFSFPAYSLESVGSTSHAWAWVITITDADWVYIAVFAPVGPYDQPFGEQVLEKMVRSLEIDLGPDLPSVLAAAPPLATIPVNLDQTIYDRFDDNQNTWEFDGLLQNGQLTLTSTGSDDFASDSPAVITQTGPGFYVEVTGEVVSMTDFYEYGLAFRVKDSNDFYLYTINERGQYGFSSFVEDNQTNLVSLTDSSLIQSGVGARNTLGVLVMGDYIEMYINGQFVNSGVDRAVQDGNVFVTTYAYQEGGGPVTVAFDDFAILTFDFTADSTLSSEHVAPVASVSVGQAALLAAPNTETLTSLSQFQFFVVFGRSVDSAYLYGYSHDYVGWIDASQLSLSRAGVPLPIQALPALDMAVRGFLINDWPVQWSTVTVETVNTPVPTSLMSYGQTITDTVEVNGTRLWTFQGVAGDVVTIETALVDNPNLDTYLVLKGPDGSTLAEDDDGGSGLSSRIAGITLPGSGLYTIEVRSVGGDGPFTLTLQKTG